MHKRIGSGGGYSIPIGNAAVVLEVVEQTGQDIRIEGYIEEEEAVLATEVGVVLRDNITDTYYWIPTEFVEVATEEEVDSKNRKKAGFKGRMH